MNGQRGPSENRSASRASDPRTTRPARADIHDLSFGRGPRGRRPRVARPHGRRQGGCPSARRGRPGRHHATRCGRRPRDRSRSDTDSSASVGRCKRRRPRSPERERRWERFFRRLGVRSPGGTRTRLSIMLNQAQTCKNRGITRNFESSNNIARPPKAGCDKQFAGKLRAVFRDRSGIWRRPRRCHSCIELTPSAT